MSPMENLGNHPLKISQKYHLTFLNKNKKTLMNSALIVTNLVQTGLTICLIA